MGDPEGNAQGGFLILDQDLKVRSAGLELQLRTLCSCHCHLAA